MKPVRRVGLKREELEVFGGEVFEIEESYEGFWVKGKNMSGKELPSVKIDSCILEHVDMNLVKMEKLKLIDSVIELSNLANCEMFEAFFLRVKMAENRMTGTKLNKLIADKWEMKECGADMMQIRFGKIKNSRFEKCNFRNADFQETDFSGCKFENCDLEGAEFSGCKLAGTDFRGSKIEGMRIGVAEVKGAIFDIEQGMKLLGLLGVEIKE